MRATEAIAAALIGMATLFATRMVIGASPPESVPWCVAASTASRGLALAPAALATMNEAGITDGRPAPRRRLSELRPEQWRDFEEALALFRADDAAVKVPDRGYLAFAARHGNPLPVRKRLANIPPQDSPADCMCNHSTEDIRSDPADPLQPLFLLWHRAYIHAFELSLRFIMRDELAPLRAERKLPAPDWRNFRLPYWDWSSEDPRVRKQELAAICKHFIAKSTLPSASSVFASPPNLASVDLGIAFQNPLYDHLRNPDIFGSAACPYDLFSLEEAENPMIAAPAELFTVFNKRFLDGWHQTVHQSVGGGGQTMGSTEYAS
ncbi:tyrosinase family protein [Nevskia ramosa]|uniref:tyrosinase family protein n=1 Tax=Nevskia ramosa TaxID=64002 RepID=UPI003D0EE335